MYDNVEQALQAVEARRRQKKDLQAFQAFVKQVCPKAFELPIIHVGLDSQLYPQHAECAGVSSGDTDIAGTADPF